MNFSKKSSVSSKQQIQSLKEWKRYTKHCTFVKYLAVRSFERE